MNNMLVHLFSTFVFSISTLAVMSNVSIAQEATVVPQEKTAEKICAFDTVENLLPPIQNQQNPSSLGYLAQQGFTENADGSWSCYASDPRKQGRYYTLLKVQQVEGKLVATSFLEEGSLMEGQENRSLELFMLLLQNHTKAKPSNLQSIQRYLETFISLVKEGKVQASPRGYLFDQPNRAFVLFHPVKGEKLKGSGITININSPQNLNSSTISSTGL
ncbi:MULTISPECIES: hypothetical protein [Nostocales]|uniref:Uncharacterized protein n=3 Tax=Nostocales TaxID=1161 RepID=A0A0C1NAA6_9CYAN|nr:hypothetical protein [Tolypothrix bouteillei]KAF3884414.1 hypothetical protein DA73_0400002190 [Tolypothrix bouteillei VB521301]